MTLELVKTMIYIDFAVSLVLWACFIKHDKIKKRVSVQCYYQLLHYY